MKRLLHLLIFILATPVVAQHQGKLASTLDMSLTLAEASPVRTQVATATLAVTARADVHNAVIRFETGNGLRLEGAARRTIELLRAGETQRFRVRVRLDGRGRARLRVSVTAAASPNKGAVRRGRTAALYFLVDERETFVSPGSFYAARLDSVNHVFGGPQPGNAAYEDALRELRSLRLRPTVVRQKGAVKTAASLTVSGTLRWTDSEGKLHPVRFADLKVWDQDPGPDDLLGNGRTNAAGFYSVTVQTQTLDDIDVYLQLAAHNDQVDVVPPGKRNAAGDIDESITIFTTPVNDVTANVDISLDMPTGGAADAFSIFDGLIVAAQFAEGLLGGPLPAIPVEFPGNRGVSLVDDTPDLHMEIIEVDKWDWDVLHHEYGHVVARTIDVDDKIGGSHGLGQHLSDIHGKSKGTRLAWAEGWPSFFGIVLQKEMNVAAMAVPNAGDLRYQDIDDSTVVLDYSLEAREGVDTMGEDDEVAVQRILWDLYDSAKDIGDEVSLGFGAIWNAMIQANPKNLSGFWNAISNGKTLKKQTELGGVFAEWGVAPKQEEPLDNQHISLDGGGRVVIQNDGGTVKLKWKKHGGGGDNFKNDKFKVEFYTPDFSLKLHESPELSQPEYTMTEMDWLQFFFSSQTPLNNKVKWIVRGSNKSSPETGPYISPAFTMIGGVDLAFVIDNDNSMGGALNGVKEAAIRILDNNFPENQRTSLFQLVTFNGGIYTDRDPITPWDGRIPTNVPNTFFGQVASIFASGNFDCAQKVGTGFGALLSRQVEMAASGTIIFATDHTILIPPPASGDIIQIALGVLQSRGIRVHILLSGPDCPKSGAASLASTQEGEDALQAYALLARETGGAFAYLPDTNSGDPLDLKRYENAVFNMAQAGLTQAITLVETPLAPPGASLTVTVSGANTSFQSGTALDFGDGITVADINVLSSTRLEARLEISPGAALGFRDVTATTGLAGDSVETAAGVGAFEVSAAPATAVLLGVTPREATVGQTLTINIDGFNTAFDASSTLQMGDGISVVSTTVLSPTQLQATIEIAESAVTGFHDVSVATGSETAMVERPGPFLVLEDLEIAAPATVAAIVPNAALADTTLEVTVTGANTTFTSGVSGLSFSGDGITVLSTTVVDSTTLTATIRIDSAATPGLRDVLVTTATETAVLVNGFEVQAFEAAAAVAAIVPSAARADTTLDVTVTGVNTTFTTGVSVLSFSGDGITVLSTTVVDSTTLTATIRIDSSATPGVRDVLVTTAAETAVLPDGFKVQGLATGVADGDPSGVPTEFALAQNYPNPFNPETVIRYQTPQSGNVELTVFNLLGQKVRVLVNNVQPAGFYTVRWRGVDDRGNRVPSGVYVYRLTGGGVSRAKKMVLLQ